MPNGKPGDHPITDIVVHGRDVYSPQIAALVREIASLADRETYRELANMLLFRYSEHSSPDLTELEQRLKAQRDKLRAEARERGFEQGH